MSGDKEIPVDAASPIDAEMTDVPPTSTDTAAASRKRKSKPTVTISQFTIRDPPWSYLHLALLTPSSLPATSDAPKKTVSDIDAITVHMHLQSALRQFLGLHGTAIMFDILKVNGNDVWVRVPREDSGAVVVALGGWVGKSGEGWRVKGRDAWGPREDSGRDLFE